MTFRYCQLAVGRNLPTARGIDWRNISAVVPCGDDWQEIQPQAEQDYNLWNKSVTDYKIEDCVMYARLEG